MYVVLYIDSLEVYARNAAMGTYYTYHSI